MSRSQYQPAETLAEVRTWTLTPHWTKPPLSMNDRMHFHAKAAQTKWVRSLASAMAFQTNIPALKHVTVEMVWTVPDKRRRDAENPVATLKPFCDGLVDAGIVADDIPALMTKLMPRIEYVKGQRGVRFELEGVASAPSSSPDASGAGKQVSVPDEQSQAAESTTGRRR